MDIRSFFGGAPASASASSGSSSSSSSSSSSKSPEKKRKLETGTNGSPVSNKKVVTNSKRISAPQKKRVDIPYSDVAKAFNGIENTSKRLEIQKILADLFLSVLERDPDCLLPCVYIACSQVAPAHHGVEIGVGDGVLTKAIVSVTGKKREAISSAYEEHGDLGLVAAKFKSQQKSVQSYFGVKQKKLTVLDVFKKVHEIAKTPGSDKKGSLIQNLIRSSTGDETKFLVRLLQGKLRIGLAEQTVLVSLAHALTSYHHAQQRQRLSGNDEKMPWSVTDKIREKAVDTLKQVQSELPVYDRILEASLAETDIGSHWFDNLREKCEIQAGIPLKPMLAKPTKSVTEVLDRFTDKEFTCEFKYDGERAQVHMFQDTDGKRQFKIYSRNSEDNTTKYPDLIEVMPRTFGNGAVTSFIMDSEVVAYDTEKESLLAFQVLSTRAKKNVATEDIKVKVIICAFDLIYLNGKSLLQTPLKERRRLLLEHFSPIDGKFCFATGHDGRDVEEIETFLKQAVDGHCEGLMVKLLDGPDSFYEPAKRSVNWLKLKKDYMDGLADSLDLVPIGAFHGRGKRTGVYGAYILAAYDENDDEYQSITKIGTGFSDTALKELTTSLNEHIVPEKPSNYICDLQPDVWFDPKQVWEVKAADLSISPIHKAALGLVDPEKGIALRFPRYMRTRDDKSPMQATNTEQVAEMYNNQNITQAT